MRAVTGTAVNLIAMNFPNEKAALKAAVAEAVEGTARSSNHRVDVHPQTDTDEAAEEYPKPRRGVRFHWIHWNAPMVNAPLAGRGFLLKSQTTPLGAEPVTA
jgi:hypothetical protein